jgi:hypothetical protein
MLRILSANKRPVSFGRILIQTTYSEFTDCTVIRPTLSFFFFEEPRVILIFHL